MILQLSDANSGWRLSLLQNMDVSDSLLAHFWLVGDRLDRIRIIPEHTIHKDSQNQRRLDAYCTPSCLKLAPKPKAFSLHLSKTNTERSSYLSNVPQLLTGPGRI